LKASVKTAEFIQSIRAELDALAALTLGPVAGVSFTQDEVDQVYQALLEGSVEIAYNLFLHFAQQKTRLWKGLQRAGVQNIKDAWQDYRANYLAAYRDYRQQLEKVWSKPELSDKKVWVEYSDNLRTR